VARGTAGGRAVQGEVGCLFTCRGSRKVGHGGRPSPDALSQVARVTDGGRVAEAAS